VSRNLVDYLDLLETGPHFTSPETRLKAAQRQFDERYALAQGGDLAALGDIIQAAETLKSAVIGYYASGAAGAAIVNNMKTKLAVLIEHHPKTTSYGSKGASAKEWIRQHRPELKALPTQAKRAKFLAAKIGCHFNTAKQALRDEGA